MDFRTSEKHPRHHPKISDEDSNQSKWRSRGISMAPLWNEAMMICCTGRTGLKDIGKHTSVLVCSFVFTKSRRFVGDRNENKRQGER